MAECFDYIIIGSGFGGSVSAMRLTDKGYSVLVLEKGKRFNDTDFAKSNWRIWKYLWIPALRAFGILQIRQPGSYNSHIEEKSRQLKMKLCLNI